MHESSKRLLIYNYYDFWKKQNKKNRDSHSLNFRFLQSDFWWYTTVSKTYFYVFHQTRIRSIKLLCRAGPRQLLEYISLPQNFKYWREGGVREVKNGAQGGEKRSAHRGGGLFFWRFRLFHLFHPTVVLHP